MNPYTELEVPVDASTEDIKQKYRTLAQLHHPDKGGNEERFKRIKQAYEILSDPFRRQQYDTTGEIHTVDIKDEAISNLVGILLHVVPNINADVDDLVFIVNVEIKSLLEHAHKDIGLTERYIEKLEKVISKLKLKSDGENILSGFIINQIKERKKELANFYRRVKMCNVMTEIINDYEYGLRSLIFDSPIPVEENTGAP